MRPRQATTGVAVQGHRAHKDQMLGLHLYEANQTFIGQNDPNVRAVQRTLQNLLDQVNARVNTPPSTEIRVGDINYRINITFTMGSQQGESDLAAPKVTALVNGKVSRVRPIYLGDFKKWTAYSGSPWRVLPS